MTDVTCVKCGSDEIHRVPQTAVEVSIAITWSKTASVEYHVCTECGFIELYVKDKAYLPNIAAKYPNVG
jgi:predicted nucleic-acid-binding Zn-ribbon protein